MRRGRTDQNQSGIVSALRQAHCRVFDLSQTGRGIGDLLVYRPTTSLLRLLEVKNGEAKRGRLTPDQVEFHRDFPVTVVCTEDEALEAMGILVNPVPK